MNNYKESGQRKAKNIIAQVKTFVKENKKQLIWLLIVIVLAWFVIELASNWSDFVKGFNEGMNGHN